MKLTCSCGATMEARDDWTSSIEARRWSEDHAVCRIAAADSVTTNDLLLSALNLFDPYGDGRLIATQSECADVYKRIANHVLPRGNE